MKKKIYSRIRENTKLSSVKPETKEERRVSQTETWKVNQREFSLHCFHFIIRSVVKKHFSDYYARAFRDEKCREIRCQSATLAFWMGASFTEKCVIKGILVSRMNFQRKCDKKRLVMYVNAPSENHFERNGVYVPIRNLYFGTPKRASSFTFTCE